MAFDAGSIEATLTLDRKPFNAGLRAARAEAEKFASKRYTVQITPRLDRVALSAVKAQIERQVGRMTIRPRLDRDALAAVKAQMERTIARVPMRVRLDRDSLIRVRAQIERIRPRIDVRLRVTAEEIAALRARLAALRPTVTVNLDIDRDALESLIRSLGGMRRGFDDNTSAVRRFGNASNGTFSRMDRTVRLVLMMLPLIAPAVGSMIVSLGALLGAVTSVFTAAGLGAAAFGAVAIPTFQKILDASKLSREEIAKMPVGIRHAANSLKTLTSEYDKLVERTQRGVGLAMAAGFDAAANAVRTLTPLVNAMSNVLHDIGHDMEQYFDSAHWKDFVDFLSKNMHPVWMALWDTIKYLTRAVFNLTEAFMPLGTWLFQRIADGMKSFADWADKLSGSKEFQKWVELAKESLAAFWYWLTQVIAFIWNLSVALAPLGNALFVFFSKMFEGLSKMPPEWLAALTMGFVGMFAALLFGATMPWALAIGGVIGLANALANLYQNNETVRKSVDGFVSELKAAFLPIWDTITNNFNNKIKPAWENLVRVIRDEFGPVISNVWNWIKDKVIPVFGEIADIITGKLIPNFLELVAALAPFVAFLTETVLPIAQFIFEKILGIVKAAFDGISEALGFFAAVFKGDWEDAWNHLKNFAKTILDGILQIFGTSTDTLLTDLGTWGGELQAKWGEVFDWLFEKIGLTAPQIDEAWTSLLSNMDEMLGVRSGTMQKIWDEWVEKLKTKLGEGKEWLSTKWTELWDWVETKQNESSTRSSSKFQEWLNNKVQWAREKWNELVAWWTDFWNKEDQIQNEGQERSSKGFLGWLSTLLVNAMEYWERIKAVFSVAMDAIHDYIDRARARIDATWRKIANHFRDPINWVIRVVMNDGILGGWNTIMGWIGAQPLQVKPIPQLPAFAKGGPIEGGIAGRDSVPILTMPGEYVLSKAAVQNMGGIGEVDRMHKAARGGLSPAPRETHDGVPGFAAGGPIWQSLWAAVRGAFSNARLTSAVRPGDSGFHGRGMAIDVAGPRPNDMPAMGAINRWIANNYGSQTKELIHTPGINLLNGKPHTYGLSTRGDHYDHVHWAMQNHPGEGGGFFSDLIATVVSWWSQVGGKAESLFRGLIPQSIPGIGGPIGDGLLKLPSALIEKVIQAAKDKLSNMFTTIFSGGGGDVSGITGPVVEQVRQVASRFGWGEGPEWEAIVRLVQKESSWNPSAANPTSSARGLFQKMTSIHGPVEATPAGQAQWGLNYIRGRYGTPTKALAFHNRNNWYDQGGWLMPGATAAFNGTGQPEAVLTNKQWQSIENNGYSTSNTRLEQEIAGLRQTFSEVKELLERRGAGANVTVFDSSGNPIETARATALQLRLS